MTNQEAIENMKVSIKAYESNLRAINTVNSINKDWDGIAAIGQQISTEDKRYKHTIDNLEACKLAIEALEKQTQKKADRVGNKCPNCGVYLASEPIGDHYCFNCGQAISWDVEK